MHHLIIKSDNKNPPTDGINKGYLPSVFCPTFQIKDVWSTPWQRKLIIIFFAQLVTGFAFSSINPFLPLYIKVLGTRTQFSEEFLAGVVYSAQAFTMMLASPFWGYLADRFGRKVMVERAMFGGGIILGLMAFVRSAEELVMLRALQGMVTGTMSAANALVAAFVPRERIGYAMGLLHVGMGVGFALGPLSGGILADTFSYRAAFYVTSSLLFIAGVTVFVGVKEEFVPAKLAAGKRTSLLGEWLSILRTPGVMILYCTRFMGQLGRMMILPVAPLFILSLLSDEAGVNSFTGLVMGTAWLTTSLSAVYLGRLGDRIGHRRIVIVCCLTTALFYIPQALVYKGWQLLLFQALSGLAAGGILPSISALLANYTIRGQEGAVYGLDNSIAAGARALAPPCWCQRGHMDEPSCKLYGNSSGLCHGRNPYDIATARGQEWGQLNTICQRVGAIQKSSSPDLS